jgi:hypothetical protein
VQRQYQVLRYGARSTRDPQTISGPGPSQQQRQRPSATRRPGNYLQTSRPSETTATPRAVSSRPPPSTAPQSRESNKVRQPSSPPLRESLLSTLFLLPSRAVSVSLRRLTSPSPLESPPPSLCAGAGVSPPRHFHIVHVDGPHVTRI